VGQFEIGGDDIPIEWMKQLQLHTPSQSPLHISGEGLRVLQIPASNTPGDHRFWICVDADPDPYIPDTQDALQMLRNVIGLAANEGPNLVAQEDLGLKPDSELILQCLADRPYASPLLPAYRGLLRTAINYRNETSTNATGQASLAKGRG
jgi:hypothetical protein